MSLGFVYVLVIGISFEKHGFFFPTHGHKKLNNSFYCTLNCPLDVTGKLLLASCATLDTFFHRYTGLMTLPNSM